MDTLIIHTLEQMKPINCNVIVYATDTDIFLLLLKHWKVISCHNLYISLVRGFVNITALMNKLGVKASYALLSLHAIIGCDTVGKFNGISKKYWFKRFFENYDNHAKLKNKLVEFQTAEGLTEETERLICETYLRTEKKVDSLENIPATRYELFRKKSYEGSKLPPTRGALQFYLKRAFHQLRIWVTVDKAQLDERDPNLYGWTLEKNKFVPRTVDVSIVPTDLVELILCNCKGI